MNDSEGGNNYGSRMECPIAKRHKSSQNDAARTHINNLSKICDWSKPSAIAIKHCEVTEGSTEITYAELEKTQLNVTEFLSDTKSSQFVGIADDTPAHWLPGLMLGIMSNGQGFVCLPRSLSETQRICVSLNVLYIFSTKKVDNFKEIDNFEIHGAHLLLLRVENLGSDFSKFCALAEPSGCFAYAITTSGSTGEPKIVRVTHNSIVPNILDLKRIFAASSGDTIAQLTPVTFDPSVIEIFLSLSCNGVLLTVSEVLKNNPEMLLKILFENRVTILQSTPSLLLHRWSGEELKRTILGPKSRLRILVLGGETLPSVEILSRCKAPENETRIFDIYGITEVSCWASIRVIDLCDSTRNLGDNLSDTILEVRDESGMIVKEGEGVLYIGSQSRICVIDDEDMKSLSTPLFRDTGDVVEIDKKGSLTLKGRRGRKVKRYGTKLYLSDLENHVQKLHFVENCYALFNERNQSLHLYFTTSDKSLDRNDKSRYEKDVLSQTMQLSSIYRPDKVCHLDRFELTAHGKICTNYLKKHSAKLSRVVQADRNVEMNAVETFTELWKNSGLSGSDSGFMDSGGSSVMALRIVNELSDRVELDFPELLGRMLTNKNLGTCLHYVARQSSNYSGKSTAEDPEALITHSSELNSTVESVHENEKQAVHPSNNLTRSRSVVPWQKCKGRNSFPISEQLKNKDLRDNVPKIHLERLYCLGKCVDASPTIFGYSEAEIYVTVGSHSGVICTAELCKKKSPEHWRITLPDRIEASVLVLDDFRGIVGSYDANVYCLHLKTGECFWKFKTEDAVKCTAVLCSRRKNVFFGSYDRHVYCVSIEKGSEVWKLKVGDGSISATPCVDAELDAVFFALLDGTCVSLKQNTGEINWKHKLDYPIFSAPVVLNIGIVVFCDVTGKLCGFTTSTGAKRWTLQINGAVFSHLVVHTDRTTKLQSLVFATQNRYIYKLECDEEKPTFRLQKDLGTPIISTPWSNDRVIVVVGIKGELMLLDFATGEKLESFKLGGDVFSSPIIHDDFIVVGCRDDNLYVLSIGESS